MRILSTIKSSVVPKGSQPRRVQFGVYGGLLLEIDLASQTQLYLGLWERETYAVIRKASSRCGWAIDVGAGRGELAIFLLRHSHAEKVIAIEPLQTERNMLARNLELNNLSHESKLEVSSKFAGVQASPEYVSLDALDVDRHKSGFLKIDVDGAEMDVLQSGANLLKSAPMDILLETHSQRLQLECIDFLTACGFSCTVIHHAWWRIILPELRPTEHNLWVWAKKN